MPMKQLGLKSLKDIEDGKVVEAFDLHLRRAITDCLDRPADKKARKITMELVIEPLPNDDGSLDSVAGQFHFKSSVPVHKTKAIVFRAHANGLLSFNPDSLENPDQATFLSSDSDEEV